MHTSRRNFLKGAGAAVAGGAALARPSTLRAQARPGVPAGTSGGGRQTWIVLFARSESGTVSGTSSTNAGTWSVWPDAVRLRIQKAACVAVPVHCVASADIARDCPPTVSVVVAEAATTVPRSGSVALPRSAAVAVATTVPTCSPSGCARSAVKPLGT